MRFIKFNQLKSIVFFIIFFTIFTLLIYPVSAKITVGQENYYALFWDNNLFGYSHYFVTRKLTLGGESFYKINADSHIKIGEGKIEDLKFINELIIHSKDYTPASFNILQKSGKQESQIQIIFSEGLAAQSNVYEKTVHQYYEEIPSKTYILINNLWGKFDTLIDNYLILATLASKGEEEKEFFVYDPIFRSTIQLTLKYIQDEDIKIKNKKYSCKLFYIIDPAGEVLFNLWVDKKQGILVKISEESGFLKAVLSNENVVKQLTKAKGLDLWNKRVGASNFILPKVDKITYFKADLKTKLKGHLLLNHKICGFTQEFEESKKPEEDIEVKENIEIKEEIVVKDNGEVKEKIEVKENIEEKVKKETKKSESSEFIEGIFKTRTYPPKIKESFKFPVDQEFDASISKFLKPQFQIESQDKSISELATTITWHSSNFQQATQKIINWIQRNIKLKATGTIPSAKLTLESKSGNIRGIAYLTVALCRASGIPAKIVGGLIYSAGNFIPHYWIEVYVGKDSWVALDPALGETDKLSAVHIALYSPGDMSTPEVKVLDFIPRPAVRVAYFRRELAWPLREKRVYLIKTEDEVISTETVQLKELDLFQDEEAYCFESQLSFPNNENKIIADWRVSPFGLPLYFKIISKHKDKEDYVEYIFNQDIVTRIAVKDNKKKELSLPISKGVYLADKRILSQLAMALGQIPNPKIGHKYKLYIFIPGKLETGLLEVEIKKVEKIKIKDKTYQTLKGEVADDLIFWIDKDSRVIKIKMPSEKLEYILDSFEVEI